MIILKKHLNFFLLVLFIIQIVAFISLQTNIANITINNHSNDKSSSTKSITGLNANLANNSLLATQPDQSKNTTQQTQPKNNQSLSGSSNQEKALTTASTSASSTTNSNPQSTWRVDYTYNPIYATSPITTVYDDIPACSPSCDYVAYVNNPITYLNSFDANYLFPYVRLSTTTGGAYLFGSYFNFKYCVPSLANSVANGYMYYRNFNSYTGSGDTMVFAIYTPTSATVLDTWAGNAYSGGIIANSRTVNNPFVGTDGYSFKDILIGTWSLIIILVILELLGL